MTDPVDPPRWRDSAGAAPEGLRRALEGAAGDVGTDAQLARLAARLGPILAPPAVVAPTPPAGAALGVGVKLGLGALGLLAVGGGFWVFRAPPHEPAAVSAPRAVVASPQAASAPLSTEPALGIAATPVPTAGERGTTSEDKAPASSAPLRKPLAPAVVSEAELLEQARSALGTSPSRALARANEHAARFPGGVLVQEREVIAIQALRKLGRVAEAEGRAKAFSKTFPGSPFQRRLEPTR